MSTAKQLARTLLPREVRNWLRSPSNSVHWAWAQAKYLTGARQVIRMRPDWELVSHPAALRFAYNAQQTDLEQVHEFDSFIKHLRPGAILYDVGAHFGLFSLAALHYGGANARALAVDPSPMATQILRQQAKLNRVADRLQIVEAAISDQVGWQSMVATGILSGGYYVSPADDHSAGEVTSTRTTTIDHLIEEFDLIPTHVKIDVEGYELAALKGAINLLSKPQAPVLFIELHNEIGRQNNGCPEKSLRMLENLDYEIFSFDDRSIEADEILSQPLIRVIARKKNFAAQRSN